MIYFSTFFSKQWSESKNIWSNHFTHYAFLKTSLLIICEKPSSKHPVLEINNDKYCSYLQMLKCSIFKTPLLNIEQGSFHAKCHRVKKYVSMHYRFILCQNYMMFPLVLPPPPILRLCIALFAVAEGWLLLDIGWFVLFSGITHNFYTRFLLLNWGNCYFQGNNKRSIFSTLFLNIDHIMTLRVFNLHIYESTHDVW